MNAVEIEEAVSDLAQQVDAAEFPFSFLAAFGNKEATIKRLRTGNTNKSDVGGVLQRNNIHIAVADPGQTVETLARLKASPLTDRQKAKFILATDGTQVEAEEIGSGEVLSCRYDELGNNFGFFLPLAGISTVAEVKNNPIDIKATSRLNRLYVQLLKDNADWGSAEKRGDLNRFSVDNMDKVHFAVEPKAGPLLSKINVVMTDQSIITMGSFFTRYCGLVSRAYIRTMLLAPMSVGSDFSEEFLRNELRKRPDLIFYWWRIFVSFALTGTHVLAPFKPSSKDEILLMEQVAFAMEIFGLAHEYAHHALDHGRTVGFESNAHREEFEADAFAMKICKTVEADQRYRWVKGEVVPNPYLETGAGGILLLSSLEIFRKVKDRIFVNRRYDTHPCFLDRSTKIKNTYVMQPNLYATSRDFCAAIENVLQCVMSELEPVMEEFSPKRLANLAPDDWEVKSFE